jgi:hypothetical protein
LIKSDVFIHLLLFHETWNEVKVAVGNCGRFPWGIGFHRYLPYYLTRVSVKAGKLGFTVFACVWVKRGSLACCGVDFSVSNYWISWEKERTRSFISPHEISRVHVEGVKVSILVKSIDHSICGGYTRNPIPIVCTRAGSPHNLAGGCVKAIERVVKLHGSVSP